MLDYLRVPDFPEMMVIGNTEEKDKEMQVGHILDLVRYATEQLTSYYNEGSLDDLKEDVDNYDEDLYDELVDNVTHTFTSEDN